MQTWTPLSLPGAKLFAPRIASDIRGRFVKTYNETLFGEEDVRFDLKESFYSTSRAGVLRGMHFQTPPFDHAKIVTCLRGAVLDVLLDLRKTSPTYGQCCALDLTEENGAVVYIPSGLAHGFLALEDDTMVHYQTSAVYSAPHDCGIRWNSIGYKWPIAAPIVSPRDEKLPPMAAFASPF